MAALFAGCVAFAASRHSATGRRATGFGQPREASKADAPRKQRRAEVGQASTGESLDSDQMQLLMQQRRRLLSDVAEQRFNFGVADVQILIPKYVLNTDQFEQMVDQGLFRDGDIVRPAEQALAFTLLQNPALWETQGAIELGAGLGLAGITLAKAGAPRVLLQDRDGFILSLASQSAVRNDVGNAVSVTASEWANRAAWPPASSGIVIGADLMGDPQAVPDLVDLIDHLGGQAVLVEPDTNERVKTIDMFQAALKSKNLKLKRDKFQAPPGSPPASPAYVLQVTLKRELETSKMLSDSSPAPAPAPAPVTPGPAPAVSAAGQKTGAVANAPVTDVEVVDAEVVDGGGD